MNNTIDLDVIVDFNVWASELLASNVQRVELEQLPAITIPPFGGVIDVVWHIHAAQVLWSARIGGRNPTSLVSRPDSLTITTALESAHVSALEFGSNVGGYLAQSSDPITFTSISGDEFVESAQGIALHVMNHGSYHRGQVMSALRQVYDGPLDSIDLIRYLQRDTLKW